MANDQPPSTLSAARRKRAYMLAGTAGFGDFTQFFASPELRSITGPARRTSLSDTTKRVLEEGTKVAERIRTEGLELPLTLQQAAAVESVILIADRPAFLIQNDKCTPPLTAPWKVPITNSYQAIAARVPKVGRIEIAIRDTVREIATGFLVGDGLVMTNRHVVEIIAVPDPSDATKWHLRTNLHARINFKSEYLVDDDSHVFLITADPIYTHPKYDLGLFRIERASINDASISVPQPLTLASNLPDLSANPNPNIYLVGYPAADNQNRIPKAVLDDIFGGIFEVKRLAPGEVAANTTDKAIFAHDCSTLGGNSGSFVMHFDTHLVVGLHYQGSYLKANYAVWLPALKDELKNLGVSFD